MPGGPPAGGPPTGGPPMGGPEGAGGGDVRSQLIQALQAMVQVADQNGIDFMSLVREAVQGAKGGEAVPPPPPPAP